MYELLQYPIGCRLQIHSPKTPYLLQHLDQHSKLDLGIFVDLLELLLYASSLLLEFPLKGL